MTDKDRVNHPSKAAAAMAQALEACMPDECYGGVAEHLEDCGECELQDSCERHEALHALAMYYKEAETLWFSGRTMPGPNEPPVWLRLYIEALMLINLDDPCVAANYGLRLQPRGWVQDVRGWKWTRLGQEFARDAPTHCVPLPRRNILGEGFPCVYLDRYEQQTSARDILICDARHELPRMLFTRDLMRLLQPRLAESYMHCPAFYVGVNEAFDKEVFWAPVAGELKEVEKLDIRLARIEVLLTQAPGAEPQIEQVGLRGPSDDSESAKREAIRLWNTRRKGEPR